MMTATTRRMWIKPPRVYEVIKPKSQRMSRMTAMVVSMFFLILVVQEG